MHSPEAPGGAVRSCPGSGKWIEGDQHSRQYYWARTNRRKDTLSRLGWHMTAPITTPAHPFNPMDHPMRDQPPHPHAAVVSQPPLALEGAPREGDGLAPLGEGCHTHGALSERQVRQIKRLPADIRAQVHALQVRPAPPRPQLQPVPLVTLSDQS